MSADMTAEQSLFSKGFGVLAKISLAFAFLFIGCCLLTSAELNYQESLPEYYEATEIYDPMPQFINKTPLFARNFNNLSYADRPRRREFLKFKEPTNITLSVSAAYVPVLPTNDYQSVFVLIDHGFANVTIKMCPEGRTLPGGKVTLGWNILALDFPTLIRNSRCKQFSMEKDRPIIVIHGTANLTVWKAERFIFFQLPLKIPPMIICCVNVVIVFFGLIAFIVFYSDYLDCDFEDVDNISKTAHEMVYDSRLIQKLYGIKSDPVIA